MNKTIEAVLKLSAKLGNVAAFNQLGAKMAAVNKQAAAYNRTQGAIARTSSAMAVAMGRALGPTVIGYGAVKAIKSYAELERRIGRIGITAEASADDTKAALASLNRMAANYAMPLDNVVEGLDTLVASGKDLKQAMAFLPAVLAMAQSSGSAVGDIANSADALAGSFGIAADRMDEAFDILAAGGKAGKFESREMAAYLPTLASAFSALGYQGEAGLQKLVAAAQTVRMQTGKPEEAATQLMNVFQKMESDETVNRFKKFGINLRQEMEKARAEGRDLLKTFIDLSRQATKGDLSKIPQLFSDAEMQKGMRALLMGSEAMERFLEAIKNSGGTVANDLNRVLDDTQSKVDRLTGAFGRLWNAGGATLTNLGAADAMDSMAGSLEFGDAMREGLKKRGMGYWDRENWLFKNTFDSHEKGMAAFEGGWRTPESILAEQGPMTASPELPSRSGYGGSAAFPVPTPRPVPMTKADQYRSYGKAASHMPRPPQSREDMAASRAQAMDGSGWANEADKVTQALASGGDKAGQAVKGAGEVAGQSMADSIIAAGRTVAADIGAAIASGAARVKAASGNPVRANVGRSGPEIEGVP